VQDHVLGEPARHQLQLRGVPLRIEDDLGLRLPDACVDLLGGEDPVPVLRNRDEHDARALAGLADGMIPVVGPLLRIRVQVQISHSNSFSLLA
jgi:hypothetical protein